MGCLRINTDTGRQSSVPFLRIWSRGAERKSAENFGGTWKNRKGAEKKCDNYYSPESIRDGLTFNSQQRNGSTPNDFLFQGQEIQDELDLGWVQFKWRNHDPAIGRFFNVDPLAEDYVHNSTYAFAENRVIDGRELEGLEGVSMHDDKTNTTTFTVNMKVRNSAGLDESSMYSAA
ncbi:MAG: hypothetical protein OEX02_19225, partial [Cyclobacteriaceae bacterium]|nr:hypothetical protein [Cyclobacteriaceae bacterium]